MARSLNVAILCGGFWQDIVAQVLSVAPGTSLIASSSRPREAAASSGLRRTILHGPTGAERACPALAPIYARKAIEYTLRALEGVRRLQPLCDSVFFVVNECDRPLFEAANGSLFAEVSDLGFTATNIISNGARQPSEWRGQLGDLQAAIQTLGTSLPLVALSGASLVLPGFNMQRVIEHSLIRDRDTLLLSELCETDITLLSEAAVRRLHAVALADTVPVPPLAEIRAEGTGAAAPGVTTAEAHMLFKAETLPLVSQLAAQMVGSAKPTELEIPHLAAELMARGVTVCGIESGTGRYRLESAQALDYVDRLMHTYLTKMPPAARSEEELAAEEEDGLAPTSLNALYSTALQDTARLTRTITEFDSVYFGGVGSTTGKAGQAGVGKYKLPSTFYMTTYRRMGADMMR